MRLFRRPLDLPIKRTIAIAVSSAVLFFAKPHALFAFSDLPAELFWSAVSISAGESQGTGFLYSSSSSVFLVTAHHVIVEPDTNRIFSTTITVSGHAKTLEGSKFEYFTMSFNLDNFSDEHLAGDPESDIYVVRLMRQDKSGALNAHVAINGKLSHLSFVAVDKSYARMFDNVLIGNECFIVGYPGSIGLVESPQLDMSDPLLRRGAIAGRNAKKRLLILDCPVYWGNSGGPVIHIEREGINGIRYELAGVVTQFVPVKETWFNLRHRISNEYRSNSGYAVATPVDRLINLISTSFHER
jgi:hypothetical protein